MALIALGSNTSSPLGDPTETVRKGVLALVESLGVIRRVSKYYRTPAFPAGNGPDFVNAVVCLETDLPPEDVISRLHEIEAEMGRSRKTRWAPRTLDLDLIALGNHVLPDADTHRIWRDLPLDQQMERAPELLILPHPRVQERAFVLVPLADVAPGWVHPATGRSVKEMLAALPDAAKQEVVALE
nr:2-amino-4-hydroxy-6-hydroxymethyldihydropteridine diphosphokinase [uncultured Roseobacter sp.]